MKQKIKTNIQKITQHPTTQKTLVSLKPEKSIWGFLGIVLFFIVPEIVAFIWGVQITEFAKAQTILASSFFEGATESSRSNIIPFGLCIPAFNIILGEFPGR